MCSQHGTPQEQSSEEKRDMAEAVFATEFGVLATQERTFTQWEKSPPGGGIFTYQLTCLPCHARREWHGEPLVALKEEDTSHAGTRTPGKWRSWL